MPRILCLETATEICSVALGNETGLLSLREESSPNAHSSKLTVFIEQCLEEAGLQRHELDAVAVSIGPGSYTGLRIGLSAAKGLCYALEIPLITVSTLRAMYAGARMPVPEGDNFFCPMIDARRMEVYAAVYRSGGEELRGPDADIVTPDTYLPWLDKGPVYFSGNGMPKCRPLLQEHPNARFVEGALPSARHLLSLGLEAVAANTLADLAYSEPFYLKEYQAKQSRKLL